MTAPAPPTPPQYNAGWVKQDTANTWAVAIRTNIVTANNMKDWGIMTLDHGGHYGSWQDVSLWADISTGINIVDVTASFSSDGALSATAT